MRIVLITLLAVLIMLLAFNAFMALWAMKEVEWSPTMETVWLRSSQELSPAHGTTLQHRSVILVHGYAGSPYDHYGLAHSLQEQGF